MRISKKTYIIIISILCFSVISLSITFITTKKSNTTFFIATTGNDNNPGTKISHIFQYDLHSNGIDYGDINESITEAPELFSNDNPLPMARWPKDDYDLTGKIINNKNSQSNS